MDRAGVQLSGRRGQFGEEARPKAPCPTRRVSGLHLRSERLVDRSSCSFLARFESWPTSLVFRHATAGFMNAGLFACLLVSDSN